MSLSGPKSAFLNFSLNLFFRYFWSCGWWQALKNGWKLLFRIFKGKFKLCTQSRVNKSFWALKSTLPNFFVYQLIVFFFWNCTRWQTFIWKLVSFLLKKIHHSSGIIRVKENSYFAQNGVNGSLDPKSTPLKFF